MPGLLGWAGCAALSSYHCLQTPQQRGRVAWRNVSLTARCLDAAEDPRTTTYNGDIRETRTDQENKDPVSGFAPCLSVG